MGRWLAAGAVCLVCIAAQAQLLSSAGTPTVVSLDVTSTGAVQGTRTDGSVTLTSAPPNKINAQSYQTAVSPATGSTVKISAYKAVLYISGATIALLNVWLPPSPVDGQIVRIASSAPISSLNVDDGSGNVVATSLTVGMLAAGDLFQFQNGAWVRIA